MTTPINPSGSAAEQRMQDARILLAQLDGLDARMEEKDRFFVWAIRRRFQSFGVSTLISSVQLVQLRDIRKRLLVEVERLEA